MKASHYLVCIGALSFVAFPAFARTPPAKLQTQPTKQDTGAKEEMPPGWKMRLDSDTAGHAGHSGAEHAANHAEHTKANTAATKFWTMPPGWHITSGPAAIYYDPAQIAGGNFRLDSETFLFPPGDRNEGYGIFFGGKDLHSEKISYTYFLIRRDGSFLVKQRRGGQTKDLVAWTAHAAIIKHDAATDVTAKNQLAIEAGANSVDFLVNGQKVQSLPRGQANPEGHVGLRVNHAINAHITYLTIKPRGSAARKIEQEVTVAGSLEDVWRAWTTKEGVTSFFVPDAQVELAPGGKYEMYFDTTMQPGKKGGEGNTVISFEPMKRLSYTWNAPPTLPNVRRQHSRVTLTFARAGERSTRVKLTHDEWGTGEEWDQAFAYFEKAWPAVLGNLQYRLIKGPVQWKDGRFTVAQLQP